MPVMAKGSLLSNFVERVRAQWAPGVQLVTPADEAVAVIDERTISFDHIAQQVVNLVRAQLDVMDPEHYH